MSQELLTKNSPLNCIRCRHCQLAPETDLSNPKTLIHCAKMGGVKRIVWEDCLFADGRMMLQKEVLQRTKQKPGDGGDRTRFSSEVEKAYLRANYAVVERADLLRVTGRSHWMSVVQLANSLGLVRGDCAKRRHLAALQARDTRRKKGHGFNARQAALIEECHRRNFWPRKHFGHLKIKGESDHIRAQIVARVNELDEHGRTWSWDSIRSHMKWVSPSYRRDSTEKRRLKRVRQKEKANHYAEIQTG